MFSSTPFLVAFSLFAACSAKPIKVQQFKCAYSSDPSVIGGDLSRCPQSCNGYSNVALLHADNWFQPIFLFCSECSTSLSPQLSQPHDTGIVH